jgi:hypothetical protein
MMRAAATSSAAGQLSREFLARLDRLKPGERVRAVLLLSGREGRAGSGRRQSEVERTAAIASMRKPATAALAAIDEILRRHGGERLSDEVSALGSIAVEVGAAGLRELAEQPAIQAVLEDQPVALAR